MVGEAVDARENKKRTSEQVDHGGDEDVGSLAEVQQVEVEYKRPGLVGDAAEAKNFFDPSGSRKSVPEPTPASPTVHKQVSVQGKE